MLGGAGGRVKVGVLGQGSMCRHTHAVFTLSPLSSPHPHFHQVLEACHDGFEIAERDLAFRGAGQVFGTGTKQSGKCGAGQVFGTGTKQSGLVNTLKVRAFASQPSKQMGECARCNRASWWSQRSASWPSAWVESGFTSNWRIRFP